MPRTDQSPQVWVTQEINADFRKAEQFGRLKFMSLSGRDDFNNIRDGEHNKRLIAHLRHQLHAFDIDADYMVLTGSPYVNAAIMAVIGAMRPREIRFLRWDNRDLSYIPLHIQL